MFKIIQKWENKMNKKLIPKWLSTLFDDTANDSSSIPNGPWNSLFQKSTTLKSPFKTPLPLIMNFEQQLKMQFKKPLSS
jgi:hypothetical protein